MSDDKVKIINDKIDKVLDNFNSIDLEKQALEKYFLLYDIDELDKKLIYKVYMYYWFIKTMNILFFLIYYVRKDDKIRELDKIEKIIERAGQ